MGHICKSGTLFHTAETFKASAIRPNVVSGRLGVGLLPGSNQVWDRATQQWLNCTPSLCLGSDTLQRRTGAGTSLTLHVNRMLYGGSRGYGIAVTSFATPSNQDVSGTCCGLA
jgi:hypothetical protein